MIVSEVSSPSFKAFWLAAAIVALVVIGYIPALRCGFIWDDDLYVTGNATLRDGAGLNRIWLEVGATPQYYPLVFTTFWLERRVWGIAPASYHLTNVLLHAATAVLLFAALRRLRVPGAWLAAVLFAIHPVQVESVAWITERKNVLSGLFYLAAFLAYMRFCGVEQQSDSGRRPWKFYALSLLFFVAALLSKTVTCTLPAAIVLILWWKQKWFRWRNIWPLIPMALLGFAAGLFTAIMERQHVGAQGPDWDFSLLERALIAGRAVWFYVLSILAPVNLMFIYPRWQIDAGEWWQYLFPLGLPHARLPMVSSPTIGTRSCRSLPLLCWHSRTRARVCERLSDAVFLCCGSLSISRQHRSDCFDSGGGHAGQCSVAHVRPRDRIHDCGALFAHPDLAPGIDI